jgi:hypothetical protein
MKFILTWTDIYLCQVLGWCSISLFISSQNTCHFLCPENISGTSNCRYPQLWEFFSGVTSLSAFCNPHLPCCHEVWAIELPDVSVSDQKPRFGYHTAYLSSRALLPALCNIRHLSGNGDKMVLLPLRKLNDHSVQQYVEGFQPTSSTCKLLKSNFHDLWAAHPLHKLPETGTVLSLASLAYW